MAAITTSIAAARPLNDGIWVASWISRDMVRAGRSAGAAAAQRRASSDPVDTGQCSSHSLGLPMDAPHEHPQCSDQP